MFAFIDVVWFCDVQIFACEEISVFATSGRYFNMQAIFIAMVNMFIVLLYFQIALKVNKFLD